MQLLRKLLFPISLIYALVVYFRNLFFDFGIFKSKTFSTPTICVGNLSVGGTGKTPMIELLIEMLIKDYSLAMLSRGYKRKSKGFILAETNTAVEDIGDEPFQIHQKFSKVAVAVDANRRNGIYQLETTVKPNLILLDDAFQHRKVKAGFSILLTTHDALFVNDWYLPTGNLRDSKSAAKRANIIVVTKCPLSLSDSEQEAMVKSIQPIENQKVLFSYLEYGRELKNASASLAVDYFKNKKLTLVTGIANPKPLVEYLSKNGLEFEHVAFGDHHFFTAEEIELFRSKEYILTTEKDFVRLEGKVENAYYIAVKHCFLSDGYTLLEGELNKFIKRNS